MLMPPMITAGLRRVRWNSPIFRVATTMTIKPIMATDMRDAAGRLKTHTDGEGHTTSYEYGQDGLPTRRTNDCQPQWHAYLRSHVFIDTG